MPDILTPIFEKTGPRLRVKDGVVLPSRCAICNRPVSTAARRFVMRWDPQGNEARQFGFVGALISHLKARRATVFVHFCPWHAQRRRLAIVSSFIVTVACFALSTWGSAPGSRETWPFVVIVIGILSSVVFAVSLFSNLYFRAVGIENGWIEIKGFGKRFRESLTSDDLKTPVEGVSETRRENDAIAGDSAAG
jgi:hypothetical protein